MKWPGRFALAVIVVLALADIGVASWLRELWLRRHGNTEAALGVQPDTAGRSDRPSDPTWPDQRANAGRP